MAGLAQQAKDIQSKWTVSGFHAMQADDAKRLFEFMVTLAEAADRLEARLDKMERDGPKLS